MSEVKRYAPCLTLEDGRYYVAEMQHVSNGDYYHKDDYATLSQQLAAARADAERLAKALDYALRHEGFAKNATISDYKVVREALAQHAKVVENL